MRHEMSCPTFPQDVLRSPTNIAEYNSWICPPHYTARVIEPPSGPDLRSLIWPFAGTRIEVTIPVFARLPSCLLLCLSASLPSIGNGANGTRRKSEFSELDCTFVEGPCMGAEGIPDGFKSQLA